MKTIYVSFKNLPRNKQLTLIERGKLLPQSFCLSKVCFKALDKPLLYFSLSLDAMKYDTATTTIKITKMVIGFKNLKFEYVTLLKKYHRKRKQKQQYNYQLLIQQHQDIES